MVGKNIFKQDPEISISLIKAYPCLGEEFQAELLKKFRDAGKTNILSIVSAMHLEDFKDLEESLAEHSENNNLAALASEVFMGHAVMLLADGKRQDADKKLKRAADLGNTDARALRQGLQHADLKCSF